MLTDYFAVKLLRYQITHFIISSSLSTVYVFSQKDSKYAYKTEIRSTLEHSSRPTSTLWVNMMARGGHVSLFLYLNTDNTIVMWDLISNMFALQFTQMISDRQQ